MKKYTVITEGKPLTDAFKPTEENVFVKAEVIPFSPVIGMPVRRGLDNLLISNGKVVNIVSQAYGHLDNLDFFGEIDAKISESGLNMIRQSYNRDDRSFAVDYILNDPNFAIEVKKKEDVLLPLLRFTNAYDSSVKTNGYFGFFRKICSNGLHVAKTEVEFSIKHTKGNLSIVLPSIERLMLKFKENEYFELKEKFEVLAETPVDDVKLYVKYIADQTGLFKFEASEKNPEPSSNARRVLETIAKESQNLDTEANRWIVYNAFNELLHGKMKKTFDVQRRLDSRILDVVMSN